MLENLRRKSLVHRHLNPSNSIAFVDGHATFLDMFAINQYVMKLSNAEKIFFSKNTYDMPCTNILVVREKYENVEFNMIACPSGNFTMEAPNSTDNPIQQKKVERPFLLGETQITQDLYQIVMGVNPSYFQATNIGLKNTGYGGNQLYPFSLQHPVEQVSWDDAVLFCNELSRQKGLDPCYTKKSQLNFDWSCDFDRNGYRLPTEMEWECAAKSGTQNQWSGTDKKKDLEEYAWFEDNSIFATHPIKQLKSNRWGFHDMSGNVWEWCWDKYYLEKSNADGGRVNRGGNWMQDANKSKCTYRGHAPPDLKLRNIGFRIARSITR